MKPHRTDRTKPALFTRRRAALAGGLLAGAALVTSLAPTAPASANTGSWEINNYRHVSYNQNEAGSDEFYLASVWFRFRPGDPTSVQVGRQSIEVIDDVDQGEYHGIGHGGHTFTGMREWGLGDLAVDRGPEIVGMATQVVEHDRSSTDDRRRLVDTVVNSVNRELRIVAAASGPVRVAGVVGASLLSDFLAGRNNTAELRNAITTYATGVATRAIVDAVGNLGVWGTFRTVRDDLIGTPKVQIFVSLPRTVSDLVDPLISGYKDGNYIGTLRSRSWETQYKNSDTRYGLYGRTRSLNANGSW